MFWPVESIEKTQEKGKNDTYEHELDSALMLPVLCAALMCVFIIVYANVYSYIARLYNQ